MKRIIFGKPYQPFFITGVIALVISLYFRTAHPGSLFDISVYNTDFVISNSRIWFLFSAYLFFLSLIYYIISKGKLKTKRWLVISHYIFIVSFLVFFAIFSAFGNRDVRRLIADIPAITLITVYGTIFFIDVALFLFGLLFLIINLFSLKKR